MIETTMLVLSVFLNIFLILYVRWLFKEFSRMNSDIDIIGTELSLFSEHVSAVYELEMFYGDETLKSLLDHSRDLSKLLEDFDTIIDQKEADIEDQDIDEKEP